MCWPTAEEEKKDSRDWEGKIRENDFRRGNSLESHRQMASVAWQFIRGVGDYGREEKAHPDEWY